MLSKQIQDQIRKDAENDAEDFYNNAEEGHDQDYYSGLIVGYKAGATAEAEKAQCLIEALEKIANSWKDQSLSSYEAGSEMNIIAIVALQSYTNSK